MCLAELVCVYQNLAKKKVGRKVDHTMRIKKLTCPSMPLSREPINFVFEYTEFYSSCVVTVLDLHPTHEPAGNRKVNSTGESKLVHDSSVNGS